MKLYFRYGTMDSSKTMRLLTDAHEYKQRGEFPLLIKPAKDTRSATGMIESRVGLSAPCMDIIKSDNIIYIIQAMGREGISPACIFIDEAQFLSVDHVIQLRIIADRYKIPVMCYGLKSDFRGNLFAGSKALFEHSNRYEEVKTICREDGCRKKALYNGRFKDGLPVFDGEQVVVGDTKEKDDGFYYIPKCSEHFFEDYSNYNKRKENA